MCTPTNTHHFVQPLDVPMIRGNKSFAGDVQHGEAVMPPWPARGLPADYQQLAAWFLVTIVLGLLLPFAAIGYCTNTLTNHRRR